MNETPPRLWLLSVSDRLGPMRTGFAVFAGFGVANLAAALLLGADDSLTTRLAIVFPLLMGYQLALAPGVLARAGAELIELDAIDRLGVRSQAAATASGFAISLTLTVIAPSSDSAFVWFLHAESLLVWAVSAPIFFVLFRLVWRLRQLGRAAKVNLLEARPLAAFGRAATSVALYIAGAAVIFILVTILGEASLPASQVASVLLLTFFLMAAVYLPLSGARAAIRAAKRAELDRIAERLGHHDEVLGAFDGPERADRLMAYRERIQTVSEWPFAIGTAPRALLYIALPMLSWVAAALVERALSVALDR